MLGVTILLPWRQAGAEDGAETSVSTATGFECKFKGSCVASALAFESLGNSDAGDAVEEDEGGRAEDNSGDDDDDDDDDNDADDDDDDESGKVCTGVLEWRGKGGGLVRVSFPSRDLDDVHPILEFSQCKGNAMNFMYVFKYVEYF